MEQEVIARFLHGQATKKEEHEILLWLDEDPVAHRNELNRVRYLCDMKDFIGRPSTGQPRQTRQRPTRLLLFTMAASVALAALCLGMWQLSRHVLYREMSDRMARLEVPAGQRVNLTLDDGTNVWLNAGTRLEYPAVFGCGVRRVKLKGEALFKVRHDADHPFVVETFATRVEVLGTTFNVEADAEHSLFRTTLVEGHVIVTNLADPSQTVTMQPNDVVELAGQHLMKRQTKNFDGLCWTEGIFYLEPLPFDELMRRFERAYNIHVEIQCTTLPEVAVRSGKVRISDGMDYALQILQQIADFDYERDDANNRIVIR